MEEARQSRSHLSTPWSPGSLPRGSLTSLNHPHRTQHVFRGYPSQERHCRRIIFSSPAARRSTRQHLAREQRVDQGGLARWPRRPRRSVAILPPPTRHVGGLVRLGRLGGERAQLAEHLLEGVAQCGRLHAAAQTAPPAGARPGRTRPGVLVPHQPTFAPWSYPPACALLPASSESMIRIAMIDNRTNRTADETSSTWRGA
jgi:hypothetical protein